jgi:Planctomycete cytochrome C
MKWMFGLALLLAGCFPEPDVGAPLAGGCVNADSDPTKAVSYGLDVQPLFDRPGTEGGCGCHTAGGVGVQQSQFDMSSLASIRRGGATSGAKIIVPGDPCGSTLVQKVSSSPAIGARMPLSGPPFWTDEEQQLLRDWIAEGANDN